MRMAQALLKAVAATAGSDVAVALATAWYSWRASWSRPDSWRSMARSMDWAASGGERARKRAERIRAALQSLPRSVRIDRAMSWQRAGRSEFLRLLFGPYRER